MLAGHVDVDVGRRVAEKHSTRRAFDVHPSASKTMGASQRQLSSASGASAASGREGGRKKRARAMGADSGNKALQAARALKVGAERVTVMGNWIGAGTKNGEGWRARTMAPSTEVLPREMIDVRAREAAGQQPLQLLSGPLEKIYMTLC